MQAGERRFTVRTSGDIESLEQLEHTVVRAQGNSIIYLRDIAHVSFTEGLPVYKARFNNQKAVFLSVVQRQGTQVFQVRKAVQAVLDAYQPKLPETIVMPVVMDRRKCGISGFWLFKQFERRLGVGGLDDLVCAGF